mmetsp:Transcript_56497/g.158524  ORF Transcript_56497/g.158524 Transcript_56497/m.158524 type:complete len:153 (-) Transcript_56497:214-672(-)|eukprot:CAMPEP_0176206682 /NCGR_PEP_ID=MMETSP0121_2-20121125/12232_1 /TAXON_ID=160619 /ORGANISM="Kryptoperidinium foliaceum, Strain CCMP 1326" /LENGTH=152 /DNA_ID=CAMNT_0017545647 /DNA_START=11 /DNA_END=469 /DNA_ORIENTATION=-
MKVLALFVSTLAAVSAFAPAPAGRSSTQINESLFDKIFQMDLFTPVKDQNDYGARAKKNIKTGKIGSNSYVPSGMSAAQYQKIRDQEDAKKAANYQRNVKKAGVFEDYTEFYKKRGTDTSQAWAKSPTKGHRMAKLKYDIDSKNGKKYDGSL